MDERVRDLEKEIIALKVANAELSTSVEHLSTSVKALTETVGALRDMMNQGRGALWLGVLAAGSVGAIISTLVKRVIFGGG